MTQLKLPFIFCLGLILFMNQSCYTYKIKPSDVPLASQQTTVTNWSFLWGALQVNKNKLVPECHRNGLSEVQVASPVHYSLLTFVTLGIVHPVKVTWYCHKCIIVE